MSAPPQGAAEDRPLTLRRMTAADVPAVLALEHQLFPSDPWPEAFFYDELAQASPTLPVERATRKYWVAEQQDRIIAYAGMMCVLPLADVQTLAVAAEAQGQGLGGELLGLIEAESRTWGAEDLLLEVRADNPGAQRLYLRNGFEQIHLRRTYYADGGDALIMRKRLAERPAPLGPVGGTS
ncbi:ribosomal protein S18-alanine N-acetyltransferase [Nesterenkonia sp. NBAIMH1]|uniref:ribosomal protein S18-alanine N-acetyltransferase n=1 Tax=Nesterenkonia sp. NBAIMH1 TaxID=2600320 RepID=UPI0011B63F13|nr:ribosomal protein S18-alanine N-acetyltransferase [Nesterenkonia sp. NBAIMH1]